METWKIILGVVILFFLPAIIFKFVDAKKLGDKIDRATEKMKAKSK